VVAAGSGLSTYHHGTLPTRTTNTYVTENLTLVKP